MERLKKKERKKELALEKEAEQYTKGKITFLGLKTSQKKSHSFFFTYYSFKETRRHFLIQLTTQSGALITEVNKQNHFSVTRYLKFAIIYLVFRVIYLRHLAALLPHAL